jgi:hypothetical protein
VACRVYAVSRHSNTHNNNATQQQQLATQMITRMRKPWACCALALVALVCLCCRTCSAQQAPQEANLTAVLDAVRTRVEEALQAEPAKTGPTLTALDTAELKARGGLNIDLAALEKRSKDSIAALNDHDVPDSDEARFDRFMLTLRELPLEEQERLQLDSIAALPAAEKHATLERLFKERQAELKEIYAALPTAAGILTELITIIGDAGASQTALSDALLDLEDHLSDMDMARDFHTLGGWQPLTALLQPHQPSDVREKAAWAIGTAVKNAPEFQKWVLEQHSELDGATALQQLLQCAVQGEGEVSSALRAKAVYALASALRHNEAAQQHFIEQGGLGGLQQACDSSAADSSSSSSSSSAKQSSQLITKVVTLLSDLLKEESSRTNNSSSDGSSDSSNSAAAAGTTTAAGDSGALASALSSSAAPWCEHVHNLLQAATAQPGSHTQLEKALEAVPQFAPHCGDAFADLGTPAEVARLLQHFSEQSHSSDDDREYHSEIVQSLQSATDAMSEHCSNGDSA